MQKNFTLSVLNIIQPKFMKHKKVNINGEKKIFIRKYTCYLKEFFIKW